MTHSSNQTSSSILTSPDNPHCQANTAALRMELHEQFMLIAQCAAEDSGNVSDENAVAAMLMADLLSVAAMYHEHAATSERADEIITFCQQQALPILADAGAEDRRNLMLAEAANRWSEALQLLSPEERCSMPASGHWADTDENHWGDSLANESLNASAAADENTAELTDDQEHAPLNMAGILASLARDVSSASEMETNLVGADAYHIHQTTSETSNTIESIDDPEMAAAFADDAQQCLAEMEASLLAIESGQSSAEALRTFLRQLHTLKGASGTVGLHQLATFIHSLESNVEETTRNVIDVDQLLQCVDAVRCQLNAHGISEGADLPLIAVDVTPVPTVPLEQLPPVTAKPVTITPVRVTSGTPSTSQSSTVASDNDLFVRVEASRLERLMDLLAEMVMLRNRRETYVDSMRTIQRELNYCSARTRTLTSTVGVATPTTGVRFEDFDSDTRRDIEATSCATSEQTEQFASKSRLLSRTVDEISKDTAELGRSLQDIVEPLSADNSAVSHLIGRFRQELMELRRLPIGGLFQRLQRVIRDAAKSEGKLVEVHFEGQGARAERAVQDRLFEPMLHLVRNAVSHGVDTPEGRVKTGKSATGKITLSAWSDASSLCIEVRDDGGGLNEHALESRGRERGLLPIGESVSRQQLWKLIFHPGLSTKTSVSEVSGRGVGMDVVDSWVKRLRGRIDVESEPGKGTTFRLHIPLRSAVEHAMVIRAGGQLFALPMHAVSGSSNSSRPMNGLNSVTKIGRPMRLTQILGCPSPNTENGDDSNGGVANGCFISLRTNSTTSNRMPNLSQVDSSGDLIIEVDAIVGVEEVVVRSLPPLLQRNELFAGVTLSGRAETVLLLDVRKVIELCRLHQSRFDAHSTDRTGAGAAVVATGPDGFQNHHTTLRPGRIVPCILVVDDSVVVRRSLSKNFRPLDL